MFYGTKVLFKNANVCRCKIFSENELDHHIYEDADFQNFMATLPELGRQDKVE